MWFSEEYNILSLLMPILRINEMWPLFMIMQPEKYVILDWRCS